MIRPTSTAEKPEKPEGWELPESAIEKKVKSYGKQMGWVARKFSTPGRRAAPDAIFFAQGRCFFIEFKRYGKKPTKLQALEHELFRKKGNTVYICDNIQAGVTIIDEETRTLKITDD